LNREIVYLRILTIERHFVSWNDEFSSNCRFGMRVTEIL